jgi:hypothetical protein
MAATINSGYAAKGRGTAIRAEDLISSAEVIVSAEDLLTATGGEVSARLERLERLARGEPPDPRVLRQAVAEAGLNAMTDELMTEIGRALSPGEEDTQ